MLFMVSSCIIDFLPSSLSVSWSLARDIFLSIFAPLFNCCNLTSLTHFFMCSQSSAKEKEEISSCVNQNEEREKKKCKKFLLTCLTVSRSSSRIRNAKENLTDSKIRAWKSIKKYLRETFIVRDLDLLLFRRRYWGMKIKIGGKILCGEKERKKARNENL